MDVIYRHIYKRRGEKGDNEKEAVPLDECVSHAATEKEYKYKSGRVTTQNAVCYGIYINYYHSKSTQQSIL
jgi:hypothetical protein